MARFQYDPDLSNDFTRWTDIYNSILSFKIKDGYNLKLENVQELIIKTNDTALAYFFAYDIGYKNYKMQNVILKAKNPKYIILFAQNIKNADIIALQQCILELNKIKDICDFACCVSGSNIKKIEKAILNHKKPDAKYIYNLIKYIDGININKLKTIIFKSKKPRYLFELAKHLKSKKDICLIEDLIIKCKSKTYIKMLAEKIKGTNLEKLEQAVLDLEDAEQIKKFAGYVKKSKMKNFSIMF